MSYLYKVDDFDGYGFNLCKIKGREGQFISNIELGSPADRGGLREGDRLVEVNGENIENKSHKKVVKRIKELKGEVSLLLVDSACDDYLRKQKIKLSGKYQDVVVIHSSKGEELLDDVDVNQFDTTEVQSITLRIEDLQEEEEEYEHSNKSGEVTTTEKIDEPIMDVVTVSFGDKSGEEATTEKTDEPIMDVVTVTFGDQSGEEATTEKIDEPIMDVVTVTFGDKPGEEATTEKTEEPIMDVATVTLVDKSAEEAAAEESDEPIFNVVKVTFGDKLAEENTDVSKEDYEKITKTLVTWGQEVMETDDIIYVQEENDRISNEVTEDWKLARDKLDEEEKDDLPKSISTSSIHSLSDEVKLLIIKNCKS